MKNKKKLLIATTAMLMFSIVCVSLTLAYVTDRRTVQNRLEMGNISVSVVENELWNSGQPVSISAGSSQVPKEPRIVNTGSEACYVRAVVSVGTNDINPSAFDLKSYLQLSQLGDGWRTAPGADAWNSASTVTVYYDEILEPGAATTPIFETFQLANSSPNGPLLEGMFHNFAIVINAQGVQVRADDIIFADAQQAFSVAYVNP